VFFVFAKSFVSLSWHCETVIVVCHWLMDLHCCILFCFQPKLENSRST